MVKRISKVLSKELCDQKLFISKTLPPAMLKKLQNKGFIERNKIIQDFLNNCPRRGK